MDERTAERLLYVEATLTEIAHLAARGRSSYNADIAVARARQYSIIRLAAGLERFDEAWISDHERVPWRLIKGMRNRIAHNYWTVDDDVVWSVVSHHAPGLHQLLVDEIAAARALLDAQNRLGD